MKYTHVMLVDENDNFLEEMEKLKAHKKGLLHRAFSIFLYRRTHKGVELLLQQRAPHKYHCAEQWSNTCCSHPQKHITMQKALESRLNFEMGITSQTLKFAGHFIYKEPCKGGLTEHEFDHVYVGEYVQNTFKPNPDEVSDVKWVEVNKLEEDIHNNPKNYTPWLLPVLKITRDYIETKA